MKLQLFSRTSSMVATMWTQSGLLIGFAYKALAADKKTLYVVNVCGHDSVGLPLARSMNTVDDNYIEHHGVDNLIIPISVSEPKPTSEGDCAFCVDVVVHTVLIKKCTPKHHLFQHLTEKLVTLSVEWVQSECGVQLLRGSCIIFGNPFYFSDVKDDKQSIEQVVKMAAELLKREDQNCASKAEASPQLPDALNLKKDVKESKKPLVQEVIASPGIRKGFLNGNVQLYGPEGSSEGVGKVADPLAHIPESLRSKCKIVDTRNMSRSLNQSAKSQDVSPLPSDVPVGTPNKEVVGCGDSRARTCWRCASFERKETMLTVRFDVPPDVVSLRDVDLSVTENVLEINGVATQLPVPIVVDGVRARFVKSSRTLVINCPIDV